MLKRTTKRVAQATLGALGFAGVISLSATVAEAGMGTSRPNPPPPPPPFTVSARVIENSAVNQTQQGWSGIYVTHTRSNVDSSTMKWTDGTSTMRPGAGNFSYQLRTGQAVYHAATMWGMTREGYSAQANLAFSTDATIKLSIRGNADVTALTSSNQVVDWKATYVINEGNGDEETTKDITIRDQGSWTFNDIGMARHKDALPNQWKRPAAVAFVADAATDRDGRYLRRTAFTLKKLVGYKKGTNDVLMNWLGDPATTTTLFEPGSVKELVLTNVGLVGAK